MAEIVRSGFEIVSTLQDLPEHQYFSLFFRVRHLVRAVLQFFHLSCEEYRLLQVFWQGHVVVSCSAE